MALSRAGNYVCRITVAPTKAKQSTRSVSFLVSKNASKKTLRTQYNKAVARIVARSYASPAAAKQDAAVVVEEPILPETSMFDKLPLLQQRQKYLNNRSVWWIGFAMLNTAYMGHLSFVMMDFTPVFIGAMVFMGISSFPAGIPAIAASYKPWSTGAALTSEPVHTEAAGVASAAKSANTVSVVVGAGVQNADAFEAITTMVKKLAASGKDVKIVVHPDAGRLYGRSFVQGFSMANLPLSMIHQIEDATYFDQYPNFAQVDLVIAVGANDIINRGATDSQAPNFLTNVLPVWEAAQCVVIKRSVDGAGHAGVTNPTFVSENTKMLLGDAKQKVEEITASL